MKGWQGENGAAQLDTASHNGYISFGYPSVRLVPVFAEAGQNLTGDAKFNRRHSRVPCVTDSKNHLLTKIYLTNYNISWFQYFLSTILNKGQQGINMVKLWSLFGLKPFKNRKKRLICKKASPVVVNPSQASRAYTLWSSMGALSIETMFAFNLGIKRVKISKIRLLRLSDTWSPPVIISIIQCP